MEVILIESKAFEKLKELIEARVESGVQRAIENLNKKESNKWLTYSEAKKILPYSSKTKWQELRDNGRIVFSQFGRKILYDRDSLMAYLKKNEVGLF